ncbi:hypothetical protein ACWEWD_27390 [Streptomyces tendae]
MSISPGATVVTTTDDPELPHGSIGTVETVYGDPADGVDVAFGNRLFNILPGVLDPADPATATSEDPIMSDVTIDWSSPDNPTIQPATVSTPGAMPREEAKHIISTSQTWYDMNGDNETW